MCERAFSYRILIDPERKNVPIVFPEFPDLSLLYVDANNTEGQESVTLLVNGETVRLDPTQRFSENIVGDYSLIVTESNRVDPTFTEFLHNQQVIPRAHLTITVCGPATASVTVTSDRTLSDEEARQVEALWKQAFPDASILPGIGLPSQGNGVMTLTHSDGSGNMLKINGLASKSPLANNALFSSEFSEGKVINLYEIMLPDIPGVGGEESTAQFYRRQLFELGGLGTDGVHFHWSGSALFDNDGRRIDRCVQAIHHQSTGDMSALQFSAITIAALQATMAAIMQARAQ